MKTKLITAIIILTTSISLFASESLIKIGDISFTDANWNPDDVLMLSRKKVDDLTSDRTAVILHFFTAQTC